MRVLPCKRHCPFICFWKPSSHLYSPGPLPLGNAPHVPSSAPTSVADACDQSSSEATGIKNANISGKQQDGILLKSCLKKPQHLELGCVKEVVGKRVQWMDFSGQDLVVIKEFESNETEGPDNEAEDTRNCLCMFF